MCQAASQRICTPRIATSVARGLALTAMSAVLIGCATIPQGKPEARPIEAYPMHSTADGLAVGCETLTEEARLQKVFGNDLVARGMLPVILTVRNDSNGTVALREQDILLAVVGT